MVHLLCFVMARWNLISRRLLALGHVPMFLSVPMIDIISKQHGMRKEHFLQEKAQHCYLYKKEGSLGKHEPLSSALRLRCT